MKKLLLILLLFLSAQSWGQIISQYVETDSGTTPKGIEIWNNTKSTLNFSINNLVIKKGTNGGTPAIDYTLNSGTLAPGKVIVIGTDGLRTVTENNGSVYYKKSFTFNGDDALEVWYGATKTDVFGYPGSDPGSSWSGNSVSTANQNIKLKPGITTGDIDGWTDPSTRFDTVSTNPSDTIGGGVAGFGIAPVYTWTGNSSSDWNSTSNWDGGYVPVDVMNVDIPSVTTYPVITNAVSSPAVCNNLTIESGASLTVNVTKALTVNGDLNIDASTTPGTLTIASDATGNGSLIVNGTVAGNATVQRYMTAYSSSSNGWHLLSSPVADFTIAGSDFAPVSGEDDLYAFDQSVSDKPWLNYNGGTFSDTKFQVGKGYLVSYKTAATKNFTGTINTGNISPVSLNYTSGAAWAGWNLLGNPYTSAIDWDNLTKSDNVDGTVYVLQASDGTYVEWNGSTGGLTDGIIPAMQGFFVHTSQTGESVTFTPDAQVHSSTNNYKSAKSVPQTLKISLGNDQNSNNTYIQFRDDATKAFDNAIDGYKLFGFGNVSEIYTKIGKTDYSINCLPLTVNNFDLPIGIKIKQDGNYTLHFSGLNSFDKDKMHFVLEDTQTGTMIDLSQQTNYDFSATKGDDVNRFVLHINGVTAVPNLNQKEAVQVFAYGKTIYLSGNESLHGTVSVFNTLGQQVYEGTLNGMHKQTLRLNQRTGIYFVRVASEHGVVTKKVFIK